MGFYLNPSSEKFSMALNSEIYVYKTMLIAYTNKVTATEQRYICVSRPRRFGKSMAANMLAAYYSRESDCGTLFCDCQIFQDKDFDRYRNKYDVIMLNIQEFLSRSCQIDSMLERMKALVIREMKRAYPSVDYFDESDLIQCMQDVYETSGIPFMVIIDEWDCILREYKQDFQSQKRYLDFLRDLLKDKGYIHLVYMTGILPVKKYGTHSALNMFDEFSMTNPGPLAEFTGFTPEETRNLCTRYDMDYEETKRWYDGYHFENGLDIYSPKSVISAMLNRRFDNYWNQTETFEALKLYIEMNFDGLKDAVIAILAGDRKKIDIHNFANDMTSLHSCEDVLTLLVHLGYLGYNFGTKEIFLPNSEVADEYLSAIKAAGWDEIIRSVQASEQLLKATWNMDEQAVAEGIQNAHLETSHLQYHDENALSYTIYLAYYSARQYYMAVREMPAGNGFADLVFLPRQNHAGKPAIVVELKWNHSAEGAIAQIKQKNYGEALRPYYGDVLLAGIQYDKKSRRHTCRMERISK